MRIAAIDIGSNAARLLISEVHENRGKEIEFIKLNFLRIPFRLGMDVFTKGKIGEEKKEMVIRSMKVFKELMEIYHVDYFRACATSAMREAKNGKDIIKEVKDRIGIEIEIISGDKEAGLIYESHIAEDLSKNFGYLYIDVGGGSTELTYYENEKLKYSHSFDIGTIRLLNKSVTEKMWDKIKNEIKNNIIGKKSIVAIGSGGNINKIFSLSKIKEGKPLNLSDLKNFYMELSNLSVKERMSKYRLREDRADVLVPALEIFTKVMTWARTEYIRVPKISVADGIIRRIYREVSKYN